MPRRFPALIANALAAALMFWSAAEAQTIPDRPTILSEDREMELALEALPPQLRSEAGVWVLTHEGYRQRRVARNGYTCIVNRDDVEAIKPTCYDPEGTEAILPAVAWFGDQLMLGRPIAQIREDLRAAFVSGRFRAPRRAGISFMLSPRIVNVITQADGTRILGTAPPHYMVYAPNVTNEDLGFSDSDYEAYPWLPYVAYQGPHGFLIITVPEN